MKTIHTFGDSHSMFGWKDVKTMNVKVNHLGPRLMYTFGKEQDRLVNLSNYPLSNGDKIIYCFGEIDCRCHVNKFINNETSYEEIIDKLVDSYIDAIKNNTKFYTGKDITTCVFSIVPPVKNVKTNNNPEYPFLGSDEERKAYHTYMNQKIEEYCIRSSIVYFDVTSEYEDSDKFLIPDLSDMICHIRDPKGIEKIIKKQGFI